MMQLARERRRLIAIAAASVLLPILIFATIELGIGISNERSAVRVAANQRAAAMVEEMDLRLDRSRRSLIALALSPTLREDDFTDAYDRAEQFQRLNPEWIAVRLIDTANSQLIFDTRRPPGESDIRVSDRLPSLPLSQQVVFSGALREECRCFKAWAETQFDGRSHLVEAQISASEIYRVMMAMTPEDAVAAIVDSNGLFIARSIDDEQRFGRPATRFVRQAIRSGDAGIYRGTTYEGFENYTAFHTSPLTGWSAHLAVSSGLIDDSRRRSWAATALAGLISLLLAGGLLWVGLRSYSAVRRSEARVAQAERLETLGKLTGGIAHDFNNMLAVVMGSLELAHRRLPEDGDERLRKYIRSAQEASRRAASLTQQMLGFARTQALEPRALDANLLLDGLSDMLRRTIGSDIRVNYDLERDLWPILVDPAQLENAIVNIATNARDAMEGGGDLTIRTRNKPDSGSGRTAKVRERVLIEVTDTGTGMAPEIRARAFEPFFTTKDVGRGTGLGLAQIFGFVRQSGGDIEIDSEPGRGTTIRMLFPRHSGEADWVPESGPDGDRVPAGRPDELILVVDDELRVLQTLTAELRELGYAVRHAAGAAEALEILELEPMVSLMLTDITMPEMGGRELAEKAAEMRPDIKIVLSTGYARKASSRRWPILVKPYSLPELARLIRKVLDNKEV